MVGASLYGYLYLLETEARRMVVGKVRDGMGWDRISSARYYCPGRYSLKTGVYIPIICIHSLRSNYCSIKPMQ